MIGKTDNFSCVATCPNLPEAGDWFVMHTRSRQEKALADELTLLGVGNFLPLFKQNRFYGRRRVQIEVPLFAGYLFVRGSIEDAYRADRTKRVARIISVTDQTRIDWELKNLYVALTNGAPLDPYPHLAVGKRVEVRAGPFRGLQGLIDARIGPTRLILQIEMLGRAVSLELDAALLDVIEADAA